MALTEFQRAVCRLIAAQRIASGESYVAGGTALNAITGGTRLSKDIDLFHDTEEAVVSAWDTDRKTLEKQGYQIRVIRERGAFVEAIASEGGESVVMQWTHDSAFRFFPLVQHADFGLTLHPFDLATNKVLALVGRLEARDWVDVIGCHDSIQPLGYLAWAACGKDPAFSPQSILEQAARSARYSAAELAALSFEGEAPDAAALAKKWHSMLEQASRIVAMLPAQHAGKCVLGARGELFTLSPDRIASSLGANEIRFHEGSLHGALPRVKGV